MTSPFPSPMDALAGLLEERSRYEAWLAQLDSHRPDVPAHVLDRVRGDYEERLQGVIEQLRSRGSELETSAAQMAQHIAGLLAEENARRDERAEGELRAAVGEFSEEYARDLLARCDEAIGRLSAERGAIGSELARVQEILSLVRRPQAAAPATEPPPPPPPPATAAEMPAPPPPAPTSVRADSGTFDELAFLQSVVEPRVTEAPAKEPVAPAAQPPVRRPEPAVAEQPAPAAPAARIFAATPDDLPAFLKEAPGEQAKTLKCQECGTMNFATEWYCERCGGELAAM